MVEKYDLIIIGSGPAGLTAGIYAGRYQIKTLILGMLEGGTITEAHKVCNFPTYNEISGFELSSKMIKQVRENNVEIKNEEVNSIKKVEKGFEIQTTNKNYFAKKIILGLGRTKQKLDIPGEEEFLGKGVSYCATCDAGFFKDKTVAVIGGSNSALTAALLVSEYAKKVYIIYRKGKFFRAEPAWVKLADKNEKIEYIFEKELKEIKGENSVKKIILNDDSDLDVDGVFVEIGSIPDEKLIKHLNIDTEKGYIIVDKNQKTNVKGVFAAGDITNNPLKQAITACGEGAVAAFSAYEELNKEE